MKSEDDDDDGSVLMKRIAGTIAIITVVSILTVFFFQFKGQKAIVTGKATDKVATLTGDRTLYIIYIRKLNGDYSYRIVRLLSEYNSLSIGDTVMVNISEYYVSKERR
ncbi:MAG: hypothetical protein LBK94_05220 [Prevotellaceae bacterium]|nr:hypothetical protein [Prevotellaceae bacterium]